jgi:hypothetical protein
VLCALSLLLASRPLAAQVGYDPDRSPFRDLRTGSGIHFGLGWLGGDRGELGIGPADGLTVSARYEMTFGGPTAFTAGFTYARLDRFVLDPKQAAASQRSGPFANDLLFVDAGLQLRLTGQKSWRHLVPYLSATLGLAFELRAPVDSGNYDLGTKFTLAPGAGVRFNPSSRVSLFADLRWMFWRLSYPTSYRVPSPADSTTILAPGQDDTDWTTHPWLSAGVAWIF